MLEDFELFVAERLFLRVNLEASTLIFDVNELALAHVPVGGDATGQRHLAAFRVSRARLRASLPGRKFVLERVNAPRSQRREFGLALCKQ